MSNAADNASLLQAAAEAVPASVEQCDIAVIGSGPGGAITATLLAEHGREVCLLEAGGYYDQSAADPFSRAELETAYARGGMTVSLGNPAIHYALGACLGGGSEVNSGLYHRPPPDMLARWGAQVSGADDSALTALCADNERDVHVVPPPAISPASARLGQGADALQWESEVIPRWHRYPKTASGAADALDPLALGGRRQSMSETFLPRFVRAGGRLRAGSRALTLESLSATAGQQRWKIHARCTSHHWTLFANHVFVAAGAVQTPLLLRRSGIKKHIGDNLRMHIFVRVIAEFPDVVNAPAAGIGVHQINHFAPTMRMGCAVSTRAHCAVALAQAGADAWLANHAEQWTHRTAYYVAIPAGCGSVRSVLGDEIVRYRLARDDYYTLADGIYRLSQALLAAGANKVLPIFANAPTLTSTNDLWRLPRPLQPQHARLSSVHLMASCPMGAATDAFGRVYGQNNLYIADSSFFYDSPNVNPQGTLMAFARRNAQAFLHPQ